MNVYLLRHGEVENSQKVLYGRLPGFHLNEAGRDHILRTTNKLKGKGIKKIYSSPLERAVETSEILIKELELKKEDLIIDDRLIESDLSKWQGTPLEEYKEKVVFGLSPRTQKEFELITPAGARILSVLDGPIKDSGEDAVVVSHGDPLVGCLIKITGDWSFIEDRSLNKYIKKGEFVRLSLKNDIWEIEEFSY